MNNLMVCKWVLHLIQYLPVLSLLNMRNFFRYVGSSYVAKASDAFSLDNFHRNHQFTVEHL